MRDLGIPAGLQGGSGVLGRVGRGGRNEHGGSVGTIEGHHVHLGVDTAGSEEVVRIVVGVKLAGIDRTGVPLDTC